MRRRKPMPPIAPLPVVAISGTTRVRHFARGGPHNTLVISWGCSLERYFSLWLFPTNEQAISIKAKASLLAI
jgi:hypothetical protein